MYPRSVCHVYARVGAHDVLNEVSVHLGTSASPNHSDRGRARFAARPSHRGHGASAARQPEPTQRASGPAAPSRVLHEAAPATSFKILHRNNCRVKPSARRRAGAPLHCFKPHQEIKMSRMDRDRPRFRREGRQLEDVNGATLPAEFRAPPRARPSREAERADADAAMQVFLSKGGTVKRVQSDAQPTRPGAPTAARRPASFPVKQTTSKERPPWE